MPPKIFSRQIKRTEFESSNHDLFPYNYRLNGKCITPDQDKETCKVRNSKSAKPLNVSKRDPMDLIAIWTKPQYEEIKKRAHVITKEERKAKIEEQERRKEQLQEESDRRKVILQKTNLGQKAKLGLKLAKAEKEASRKNLYVLQRAFELQQEQEDEMKNANSLILATKCLAIREAQIAERELIKKELQEENQRLDAMMEQERQKALQEDEKEKRKEEDKIKKYVKEVSQQMHVNELQRFIEAERREVEKRKANQALSALQKEDAEKLQQGRLKQEKIKEDLNRTNAGIERYKLLQKEEERIADLRVQEFMRMKAEREHARDLELMEAALAREREIAYLRTQQEKAKDQKDLLDEINSLRIQEEVEKQWRDREKLAASKRKQLADDMKKGRKKQVEDLQRMQAREIERDEQEYRRVAEIQKQLYMKDLEEKQRRKEAAVHNRDDLIKQMNEKEMERIHEHKEKFDAGVALRLRQETHNEQIQNLIRKKVQKMRDNVPEHYVKDVERQLKLI